jgi:8-oxo-dGTP pyrophosphatase MutT (NUDIX family)
MAGFAGVPMTFPCIAAARRFRRELHWRFVIAGQPVGWVRSQDVPLLARWRDVFTIGADAVVLNDALSSVAARSAALGAVIGALAADGRIPGWRDETYAIRNAFDDTPLAFIERAASRFFGTMTYAVHVNGIVQSSGNAHDGRANGGSRAGPDGCNDGHDARHGRHARSDGDAGTEPAQLWIARRSDTKQTDPGMLDNLVGGGIGWGFEVEATLIKECYEESGVAAALARTARRGRTLHVLQEIPEGTQAEQLFVYDLWVPPDFAPLNTDGEVAEHRLAGLDEVLDAIGGARMTVDASLATLDCLLRHGWIDAARCVGFHALLDAPNAN